MEQLRIKALEFQNKLQEPISTDDAESCLVRITEVEIMMVESGKLLADAKFHQDTEQSKLKEILADLNANVSASTLNNYIKSRTINENYMVNWFERINRSSTHLCENLRTVISYRKEEMRNLNYKI